MLWIDVRATATAALVVRCAAPDGDLHVASPASPSSAHEEARRRNVDATRGTALPDLLQRQDQPDQGLGRRAVATASGVLAAVVAIMVEERVA